MLRAATRAAVLATVALASSVSAEVRLKPAAGGRGPTVQVVPTTRGPWSPVGVVNDAVLNPAGDLLGDGMPAFASAARDVVVAWGRSATEQLWLAGGTEGWRWAATLDAPGIVGVPRPRPLGSAWVVAWQTLAPEPYVWLSGVGPDGDAGDATMVGAGYLVDAWAVDGSVHVVVVTPESMLDVTTVEMAFVPEPSPIPVPINLRTATLANVAGTHPTPAGGLGASSMGEPEPRGNSASIHPAVLLHDGTRADGTTFALLTWWLSTHELGGVELDAHGPILPVDVITSRGGAPYQWSLVERAIREAGDQ
jgi:hypothetical protein